MRFSTFVIVAAVFAVGAVGYASVFAASGEQHHGAGPAAWPTFVDSRNVIYMGPRHRLGKLSEISQQRQADSRILADNSESRSPPTAAKRVASLGPVALKSNLSTGSVTTRSAHSRPTAPLPASAGRSLIQSLDWSAFRTLLKEPRKVAILLPRRKVLPVRRKLRPTPRAERLLAVAAPIKVRPRFDTSMRSSLGGPKPAEVRAVAKAREATSPAALVRTPSTAGLHASHTSGISGYRRVAAADIVGSDANVLSASRRHVSPDPGQTSYGPMAGPPQQIPALEDGNSTANSSQATIAVRETRAVRTRRARSARRAVQRRQARARQRNAQKRRNVRRAKRAKRSRSGKYGRYQASRNRKIANQIRLRRRLRGIY